MEETMQLEEDQNWQLRIEQLLTEVNAIKAQFDRKAGRHSMTVSQSTSNEDYQPPRHQPQKPTTSGIHPAAANEAATRSSQRYPWHNLMQRSEEQQHHLTPHQQNRQQQEEDGDQRRNGMVCWNCDEEGHRFMDCSKPQAVLFCYRCGRKGYSLRSCFTCRTETGNPTAGNRL